VRVCVCVRVCVHVCVGVCMRAHASKRVPAKMSLCTRPAGTNMGTDDTDLHSTHGDPLQSVEFARLLTPTQFRRRCQTEAEAQAAVKACRRSDARRTFCDSVCVCVCVCVYVGAVQCRGGVVVQTGRQPSRASQLLVSWTPKPQQNHGSEDPLTRTRKDTHTWQASRTSRQRCQMTPRAMQSSHSRRTPQQQHSGS
jgi:hypothetical protein